MGKIGGWFGNLPWASKLIKDDEVGTEPKLDKKRPRNSEPQGKEK